MKAYVFADFHIEFGMSGAVDITKTVAHNYQ